MSLSSIDDVLSTSAEADEALRAVVAVLSSDPAVAWAGIAFAEQGDLVLGPSAGTPDEARRKLVTVCYKGEVVGELRVDGNVDPGFLTAVAERISAYVLLGWDTGGETWDP